MARRPETPATAMTREELKDLKRSLSLRSPHTVRDNYTVRGGDGVPSRRRQLASSSIQPLVTL